MDTVTLPSEGGMIENRAFDEIALGESASLSHRPTEQDVELFAVASGKVDPRHLDRACAETDLFHKVIGHGMWSGAMISAVGVVVGARIPIVLTSRVDSARTCIAPCAAAVLMARARRTPAARAARPEGELRTHV